MGLPGDVGVVIGACGATASSKAADIVLTVDRHDRHEAVVMARRALRIATQSLIAGMGCRSPRW